MKVFIDGEHVGDSTIREVNGHSFMVDGGRIRIPFGIYRHEDGTRERVLMPDSRADAERLPGMVWRLE